MRTISLVYAQSRNGIIGSKGGLPWHLPSDLKRFKAITLGKPIIMGRKTWESLPRKPLPGRQNIVITRQAAFLAEGADVVGNAQAALARAGEAAEVCVIGGGEIYRMFMPVADRIYLTEVDLDVAGDTAAPKLAAADWHEVSREVHAGQGNESAGFVIRVLERHQLQPAH